MCIPCILVKHMLKNMDFFHDEFRRFEDDVNGLILGTMDAAIAHLDGQIDPVLAELKSRENQDDVDRDRLGEHYSYLLSEYEGQTAFLRNSTLVSLASQLTHSLHKMASFGPLDLDDSKADRSSSSECDCGCDHKKGCKCQHRRKSEYERLGIEYKKRFEIDFLAHKERIKFIEPMRMARNRIVHEGGYANTLDPDKPDYLDTSFSRRFREYVPGEGYLEYGAQVVVSDELLRRNAESAIALVRWVAEELRKRQLANLRETKTVN